MEFQKNAVKEMVKKIFIMARDGKEAMNAIERTGLLIDTNSDLANLFVCHFGLLEPITPKDVYDSDEWLNDFDNMSFQKFWDKYYN